MPIGAVRTSFQFSSPVASGFQLAGWRGGAALAHLDAEPELLARSGLDAEPAGLDPGNGKDADSGEDKEHDHNREYSKHNGTLQPAPARERHCSLIADWFRSWFSARCCVWSVVVVVCYYCASRAVIDLTRFGGRTRPACRQDKLYATASAEQGSNTRDELYV